MKKTFFLITTILLLLAVFACQKEGDMTPPKCTGDCLFALGNAKGTIVYLDGFDRFAIKTDVEGEAGAMPLYAIPDEMESEFEVVGMEVQFSAIFRENKLTPSLPDPGIEMGSLYQIKLENISERD
jgi:hypothetical protein